MQQTRHSLPLVPVELHLLGAGHEDSELAALPHGLGGEEVGDEEGEAAVVKQPPHVDAAFLLLDFEPIYVLQNFFAY